MTMCAGCGMPHSHARKDVFLSAEILPHVRAIATTDPRLDPSVTSSARVPQAIHDGTVDVEVEDHGSHWYMRSAP